MFWNNQVNDFTEEDRTGNIEFAERGCTFFSIESASHVPDTKTTKS